MDNQFANAMLALVFAAILRVSGQFYLEKSSARTERIVTGTLSIPAR